MSKTKTYIPFFLNTAQWLPPCEGEACEPLLNAFMVKV